MSPDSECITVCSYFLSGEISANKKSYKAWISNFLLSQISHDNYCETEFSCLEGAARLQGNAKTNRENLLPN